jgi:hypothetical protein
MISNDDDYYLFVTRIMTYTHRYLVRVCTRHVDSSVVYVVNYVPYTETVRMGNKIVHPPSGNSFLNHQTFDDRRLKTKYCVSYHIAILVVRNGKQRIELRVLSSAGQQ